MERKAKGHTGKAAQFEGIFERLSDELFRHAALRLSDRERAVELTQECFLRGWEYIQRGEVIEEYRPFLYRVLNNLIIDEYRRRKPLSLDAMLEHEETRDAVEGALLGDETQALEESLIRFEIEQVVRALHYLPERYRDALVMRYIDGLSIAEIAEQVQESPNAVSVRIHRALRKLREIVEHHGQF